jgi:hypothetical protein
MSCMEGLIQVNFSAYFQHVAPLSSFQRSVRPRAAFHRHVCGISKLSCSGPADGAVDNC